MFTFKLKSRQIDEITDLKSSSAEAIAGTDDTTIITPLKLRNGLNASGSAPVYACRAWVNFNGTGTPAVIASGNVSSITDNGAGDYTINFTTALEDGKYAAFIGARGDPASLALTTEQHDSPLRTISAFRIYVFTSSLVPTDYSIVNVAIFR